MNRIDRIIKKKIEIMVLLIVAIVYLLSPLSWALDSSETPTAQRSWELQPNGATAPVSTKNFAKKTPFRKLVIQQPVTGNQQPEIATPNVQQDHGQTSLPMPPDKQRTEDRGQRTEAKGQKAPTQIQQQTTSNKQRAPSTQHPVTINMVYIPAGEFIMGSNTLSIKTRPERKVFLKAYYIDRYEATNGEYKKFIDTTGHEAPDLRRVSDEDFVRYAERFAWRNGVYPSGRKYHPVQYVNWDDAKKYCKWAGKRLPTEEEWEKAARGTDGRKWPWGNEFNNEIVNTGSSGFNNTEEVDFFPSGISPYGVYGMGGNVWEWTATKFKPYPGNDMEELEFEAIAIRGGSWDSEFNFSQTAYRDFSKPEIKKRTIGFRCAKDAD